ncbi:hypothetical protein HFX_1296 [Haloferax mediterranei ATCC 33500]|uniref:Uncharacterized protein n=1 Tax=Haloferax mediterranei (strain ATCC 33500 / DSM 1411 / JCM 8866 / NBRC 14739 / NCIMB 2177 / R-4) TaxID=523841 RepID=I3R448_HALMT|nr:hypothetical protein HFX_1296 [Haloferax mediterranei ATCC 33500]
MRPGDSSVTCLTSESDIHVRDPPLTPPPVRFLSECRTIWARDLCEAPTIRIVARLETPLAALLVATDNVSIASGPESAISTQLACE